MRRRWGVRRLLLGALLAAAGASSVSSGLAMTPNDPSYGSQWESVKVGLPAAWEVTTGSAKIVIAVVDTGVAATNKDLAGKLRPGRNVVAGTAVTDKVASDHGTKMAGIAAAAGNNGFGMIGAAPGCPIMPIQVTSATNGYASWSNVATGLRWAADHGAKVAIVAYQVTGTASVEAAAKYFREKGGLVFASVGNDGKELGCADSPNIITVTATDRDDKRYNVANWGRAVDLAAPGVKITATSWYDGIRQGSGTSDAAAFAAGVAALVWSANPSFTPDQVEGILRDTAVDLGAPGRDPYFGWGRVNAAAAVAAASQK